MKKQTTHQIKITDSLSLAIVILLVSQTVFGQRRESSVWQLKPNQTIERDMTGAEIQHYEIALQADEFFQVRVEQQGIDIALKLLDESGKVLVAMDSPNEKDGPEILTFVAAQISKCILEVSPFDPKAVKASYSIKRMESRKGTAIDRRRMELERTFVEGLEARSTDRKAAIVKLEAAMAGWQQLQDEYLRQLTARQLESLKKAQDASWLPLPIGETIERIAKGGDIHQYAISLKQGQVLRIDLQKKGLNIRVVLLRFPEKQVIGRADYSVRDNDREILTAIVPEAGPHLVLLGSSDSNLNGSYSFTAQLKDSATAEDHERIRAYQLLGEGLLAAVGTGDSPGPQTAIAKWEEAVLLWCKSGEKYWEAYTSFFVATTFGQLGEHSKALQGFQLVQQLYRETNDKEAEATTFNRIGLIHSNSTQKQKALDNYQKALELSRAINDKIGQAVAHFNSGQVYLDMYKYPKARHHFDLALPLYRAGGDKDGEAAVLTSVGRVYARLGEYQTALKNYELALPVWRELDNHDDEAATLYNISKVYSDLGDKHKALEYLERTLPLRRSAGNQKGEAESLNGLGHIYSDLGEQQTALNYLNLALPLFRKFGDKRGEASTLVNIGRAYLDLGEKQKAFENYAQARSIFEEVNDKRGQAIALSNMGGVRAMLGEPDTALTYLNQALPLRREVNDKEGEAATLNNIAAIQYRIGDEPQALAALTLALSLTRSLGLRRYEVTTLNNMGRIYSDLGQNQKAVAHLNQSLPLVRATGNKDGEAATLFNLMGHWTLRGNRRLAIFYGKLSVNTLQQLREREVALGLDPEFQKAFVTNAQNAYLELAELLIEEGQFDQALQVLDLSQDQQFFDFDRLSDVSVNQVPLSPRENQFARRYEAEAAEVGRIVSEIDVLKRQLGMQPNDPEGAEFEELRTKLKIASERFFAVLTDAGSEFSKPRNEQDAVSASKKVAELQQTLKTMSVDKQNIVVLYTLIGAHNFRLLLVSADSIKSFASAIEADEFELKLKYFSALLQSSDYDPRPLGKELYDLILGPASEQLKKQNAQTLLWLLGGRLRYVPMSALWDGEQYLVERYRNVVFTRAESERLTRNVREVWTGVGFGSSRERVIVHSDNGENRFRFNALENMDDELKGIFKPQPASATGVLAGKIFTDDQFTKPVFYKELAKRPPVVHISSHFLFYPGDYARSFLVLGERDVLTLAEMKEHRGLFDGVELLTLSACKTAATKANAYGKEIDGFAELAQRLGAGAVLATLWEVNEGSTAELMKRFYENRQIRHLNKSEALRATQLDLLHGRTPAIPISRIGIADEEDIVVDKKYLVPFKLDPKRPFAHPYYWSPFVLFGNWK